MPNVLYFSNLKVMWLETQLPWISTLIFFAVTFSLLQVLKPAYYYFFPPASDPKRIPQLRGFSVVNAVSLLNKRHSFLQSNQEKIGQDVYAFKAFQVSVTMCKC